MGQFVEHVRFFLDATTLFALIMGENRRIEEQCLIPFWEVVSGPFCMYPAPFYGRAVAEAVLDDLGVRQALKDMPDDVRL